MDLSSDDDWENNPDRLNKMAVLAISYHNIGSFLYSSSDPQPYDVSIFFCLFVLDTCEGVLTFVEHFFCTSLDLCRSRRGILEASCCKPGGIQKGCAGTKINVCHRTEK